VAEPAATADEAGITALRASTALPPASPLSCVVRPWRIANVAKRRVAVRLAVARVQPGG
jgi:hypothetical protein